MMDSRPRILVVDDSPPNIRLLEALLAPAGYTVLTASSGFEGLEMLRTERPDLLLVDIVMPDLNGYEVCRRVREDPATSMLPVVMLTASLEQEKVQALEAGADDFIARPFNTSELLGRVKSLLRIKTYHDTIQAQAVELADWNRTLERRVADQVAELERFQRLRRFFTPQVAELVLSDADRMLESHRREITVVFCDLRGFTAFSSTADPEDVMGVVNEFYAAVGEQVFHFQGTLEQFAGDSVMTMFNDPVPCPDPAARAVRMAVATRESVAELNKGWRRSGHELDLGVGIAEGFATMGRVGFEGRFDYRAIGPVVNLASRLCARALGGQILLCPRTHASVADFVETEPVGLLSLKGFAEPVSARNVVSIREAGLEAERR